MTLEERNEIVISFNILAEAAPLAPLSRARHRDVEIATEKLAAFLKKHTETPEVKKEIEAAEKAAKKANKK